MAKCKTGYIKSEGKCVQAKPDNTISESNSFSFTPVSGGFIGLLTLLFIGLKLTDYIRLSWFWILSPLWISFLIGVIFVLISMIIIKRY